MSNKKTLTPLKTSSKRRAFSLIELSIVLIIIGLLIAGITGGASLIKSASLRAAMGEARGYNVAVNSFYVQFDSLPGDSATIINGTVNSVAGDANGQIQYVDGITTPNTVAEGANAWCVMKNAGIIDNVLAYNVIGTANSLLASSTTAMSAQVPGTGIPASKVKSAGWTFDYLNSQNVAILTGSMIASIARTASTAYTVLTVPTTGSVPVITGAVTPSDGLSIDTKMDDGLPTTGKVRSPINNAAAAAGTCVNTTGNVYYTTATTTNCAMTFQVDIT
jgi:prepilin-type N-terminal cleavage/methylation domain-containing protein